MPSKGNQPVEERIETSARESTGQTTKLAIEQAERLHNALLEREATVEANRPLQTRLISLLARDEHDATIETVDAWRCLADDLHSSLDSMLILAEGYATLLRQLKGPSKLCDMTDLAVQRTGEDFIKPFYAAASTEAEQQRSCSTP